MMHLTFVSQLCCAVLRIGRTRVMLVRPMGSILGNPCLCAQRRQPVAVICCSIAELGARGYECVQFSLQSQLPVGRFAGARASMPGVSGHNEDNEYKVTELCKMAADTVVIFITWLKTWSTIRMVREHNVKTPLMTMLLRDGTFYFLGLLTLNALNLAGQTTNVFSYASTFSTPLSAMIITHFPLSLRQLAHGSSDNTSRPSFVQDGTSDPVHSQTSSLRFGSFVGNMSESLMDGSEDDDRDVAWDNDVQNDVDDVRLDAQIIHDSSGVSSTPAPVSDPMPEDIVEGEKRLDQAANVGPLT
ncbi:hypothetical protein CERSUDRAFT_119664 [Gelatoporia subvermispora B]|uniref:Uncharacterized protein n=1 Tax=Ceriporiopsis subvermispora (strain B) TaxID=914234 RepID=M2P8C1_CERS8|nr:hypothetical protein CERSUDRAFT_119664 [Gelatoporia subvermispora B]